MAATCEIGNVWGGAVPPGAIWTWPSGPAVTGVVTGGLSPTLTCTGASVEKVFTLAMSMVTSPAASVLITSLPPAALTTLPVSRSPLRKITSSAATGAAARSSRKPNGTVARIRDMAASCRECCSDTMPCRCGSRPIGRWSYIGSTHLSVRAHSRDPCPSRAETAGMRAPAGGDVLASETWEKTPRHDA